MLEIDALKKLTGAEDDEGDNEHVYGSALNPHTLHTKGEEKKEMARPNAEIVVKTNNRAATGGANSQALAELEQQNKVV